MLNGESRFSCPNGDMPFRWASTWHGIDWDQRRAVSVTIDGEQDDERDDDGVAIKHFGCYSSQLSPDVYEI